MVQRRVVRRRKRRRADDEEHAHPVRANKDRFGLMALQQRVGNQAVQRLIAQAKDNQDKEDKEKAVEIGEVQVRKPEIEYYEVSGNSLAEVKEQLLPPTQWYEYQYQYKPKVENGVVTQLEVEVFVTLRLPQWLGPGWDQAPDADKFEWLEMLQQMGIGKDLEYEEMGQLPEPWLLGPAWESSSDELKKEWQAMIQKFHEEEETHLDLVRRRVMVLQQRMFNQPEDRIQAVFDQFLKDLKIEQEAYDEKVEFGQQEKISLESDPLLS